MTMNNTQEYANARRTQHSKCKMLQQSLMFFLFVDGAIEGITLNVIPELPMQDELCSAQDE
jgi:hypothetical protein